MGSSGFKLETVKKQVAYLFGRNPQEFLNHSDDSVGVSFFQSAQALVIDVALATITFYEL